MSKKRENDATANVVPIIAAVPPVEPVRGEQQMTPVERRIILEKLNAVYVNETVGYSEGWNDQKVADDQGVPRVWVAEVRDLLCGPDIGTQSVKQLDEAHAVANEIKALVESLQPFLDQMQALQALTGKADTIMSALVRIEDKKR